MNYADIKTTDVANGKGVRVSIFVSGCNRHCPGCHNREAWDFNYGKEFNNECIEKIMNELNHPYVQGLTLLGGEPMEIQNQRGLLPLVKKVKEKFPNKNIWCYTGYTFDKDIMNMCKQHEETKELMSYIDVMVDGEFIQNKKDLNLKFRGSSNQRIIDVKKSMNENKIVEINL